MSPITNPLYRITHWTFCVDILDCIKDEDGFGCIPYDGKYLDPPLPSILYRGLCGILWLGLFCAVISPVTLIIKALVHVLVLLVGLLEKLLDAIANTPKYKRAVAIDRVKYWASFGGPVEGCIESIGTEFLTEQEIRTIYSKEVERLKSLVVDTTPLPKKEFNREAYDWMTPLLKFAKFVVTGIGIVILAAVACGVIHIVMFAIALLVFLFNLNTILAVVWFIVQGLIVLAVATGIAMLFKSSIEKFFSNTDDHCGSGYKTGQKICSGAGFVKQCFVNAKDICALFYSDNCPRITLKD